MPAKCEKILVQCATCGESKEIIPSKYNRCKNKIFFCSTKCCGIWRTKNLQNKNSPKFSQVKVNCAFCGKELSLPPNRITRSENNFCNNKCKMSYLTGENAPSWTGGNVERKCKWCGKIFYSSKGEADRGNSIYCSNECQHEASKTGKNFICPVCNKEFYLKKSRINKLKNGSPTCSKDCQIAYQKISGRVLGENNPNWIGGSEVCSYDIYANRFRGIEEIRRDPNNYLALQAKCTYCGKWMNPSRYEANRRSSYIEGKTTGESRFYCKGQECRSQCSLYRTIKYPRGYLDASSREVQAELRKIAFERDGFKCIKCGSTKKLQAHHIIPVKMDGIISADVDNVITLCSKCHRESHKKDGCGYSYLSKLDSTHVAYC